MRVGIDFLAVLVQARTGEQIGIAHVPVTSQHIGEGNEVVVYHSVLQPGRIGGFVEKPLLDTEFGVFPQCNTSKRKRSEPRGAVTTALLVSRCVRLNYMIPSKCFKQIPR